MAEAKSFEINGIDVFVKDEYARNQLDNIANKATKKQKVLFQLKRIVKFLAPYLADLLFQLLIKFLKYKLGL